MGRLAAALALLAGCAAPPQPSSAGGAPTMYILLWFDTEDYLLPASDDAALRLAQFLTKEGVRTTFKVVGEKARTLEKRGRTDVIEALKKHEIGYHSNFHSVHPTPAQYLSTLGWDEGVEEFLRREGPGFEDVKRIFGQSPSCYGQPGSSWGPQSFGALRKLGIPVYLDSGSHVDLDRDPLWYCGILTLFRLEYTLRTGLGGPEDLEKAKKSFGAAREKLLKEGGGVAHIFYHPCEWVHKQFWDGVNFADGANPPREEWKLPPQKTAEETRVAFETFESYIRWIKTFPDVEFITARDALRLYADKFRERPWDDCELQAMGSSCQDNEIWGPGRISAGDYFCLLNKRLLNQGVLTHSQQRTTLAPQEPPFGPTGVPMVMSGPVKASWSQVRRTAADVQAYIERHGRIPNTVWLGSTGVTPESYLAALSSVLPHLIRDEPPKEVEFRPAKLATEKYVADDSPKIWGWLFPKGFHAPEMMQLARRQAWTIKRAVLHQP